MFRPPFNESLKLVNNGQTKLIALFVGQSTNRYLAIGRRLVCEISTRSMVSNVVFYDCDYYRSNGLQCGGRYYVGSR